MFKVWQKYTVAWLAGEIIWFARTAVATMRVSSRNSLKDTFPTLPLKWAVFIKINSVTVLLEWHSKNLILVCTLDCPLRDCDYKWYLLGTKASEINYNSWRETLTGAVG